MLQQVNFLAVRDLADVLDRAREMRPHELVEVLLFERLAAFARELQRNPLSIATAIAWWAPLSAVMRPRKRR